MSRKKPTEHDINKVMNETGMESLQARNHLIQQYSLAETVAKERTAKARAAIWLVGSKV